MCGALAASSSISAIVIHDRTALRAEPREAAQLNTQLWRGEALEVRGERKDYLQVYDYKRERGGYVRASEVHRTRVAPEEAPTLLALVRFLRDTIGAEALGIGLAAAYFEAALPETLNRDPGIEALDALGTMADRLAHRSTSGTMRDKAVQQSLSAHLEVARSHGVKFSSHDREGRMYICYDGDAFRRVLAMPSSPEQRARAALGLTRDECVDPNLNPLARRQVDEWRAEVLDRADASELPAYLRNRVLIRRAAVWSGLAYQRTRLGEPEAAAAAAKRALSEIAGIDRNEIAESDAAAYNDAAMRVSASRWAAVPAVAPRFRTKKLVTEAGRQPGETCIALMDEKADTPRILARRCTFGLVWIASAKLNRAGSVLALAVQQTDTWRELWMFRKDGDDWAVSVLPPSDSSPELGYVEFAGWAPDSRHLLVAREARSEGRYRRSFELVRIDTLVTQRRAGDPALLTAFQRWQDPGWRRDTLSIR
ncbi:MAG: hypothetical protein ACT4PS_00675 [Betaproteobacteria bacterium]